LGILGVFTPPCSSQVPGYITDYEHFKAIGGDNINVVAVNDVSCSRTFYAIIISLHHCTFSGVRFIADDEWEFTSPL
ncbi:hypothetical protein K503DRAFT_675030, partial [Rhizopogon vinicolor AM-OR11-026]